MENTEASVGTASTGSTVLVLKDEAGSYFLLPQETLEQGRVPAEHKAEIERLVAASGAAGGDVQGYVPLIVPVVIIGVELALIIGLTGPEVPKAGTMTNAQFVQAVIDRGRGR